MQTGVVRFHRRLCSIGRLYDSFCGNVARCGRTQRRRHLLTVCNVLHCARIAALAKVSSVFKRGHEQAVGKLPRAGVADNMVIVRGITNLFFAKQCVQNETHTFEQKKNE